MKKVQNVIEILNDAIQEKCSDIYFLPREDDYVVRFCVGGMYYDYASLSQQRAVEYINFFKFKADMNISENRRPQLGSWEYVSQTCKVNCRFSSVGNFLGKESLVIRLIYGIANITNQRYYEPLQWEKIVHTCLRRGLILFCGPTGSGKTTSMYELVKCFYDQQILCVEDPVEIYLPEVLQLQVNQQAGMTYDELIKVALRHHPDIFVIGEIRDSQTADAAVKAALSGHLVLSTVHALHPAGVINRLLNLGVNLHELNQVLRQVNYQRLIPNVHKEVKVLFDQLNIHDFSLEQFATDNSMTERWRKSLENLRNQGEISEKTYQKYLYG